MNDDLGAQRPPIPPGDYAVMVVDVGEPTGEGGDEDAELSLVILRGPLKGQVVGLRQPPESGDLLGLLGAHGTLTATDEAFRLQMED